MMDKKKISLTNSLNRRVELWRNTVDGQKNELGQDLNIPVTVADLWAGIISLTGSLLSGRTAETTLSKTTHKIIIRYTKNIKPSDWFIYKGKRFNILYISDPDDMHRMIEAFCEVVSVE